MNWLSRAPALAAIASSRDQRLTRAVAREESYSTVFVEEVAVRCWPGLALCGVKTSEQGQNITHRNGQVSLFDPLRSFGRSVGTAGKQHIVMKFSLFINKNPLQSSCSFGDSKVEE